MYRKLYALLILIGAIGALLLVYLYFFVYYTSTIIIDSNVGDYKVQFFSKSTAQKWDYNCPEKICNLKDISPFDYNISIIKPGYEREIIPIKVKARKKETLVVFLEKEAKLETILQEIKPESNKEKISRLREENQFLARFEIESGERYVFSQNEQSIIMQLKSDQGFQDIYEFSDTSPSEIFFESISNSDNYFITIDQKYYIFTQAAKSMTQLPFTLKIHYIKGEDASGKYGVHTEKGYFSFNILSRKSDFKSGFDDFIEIDDHVIGVIYASSKQKKKNYGINTTGNIIIKYSPKHKTQKVLLSESSSIKRIEKEKQKIFITTSAGKFELVNY